MAEKTNKHSARKVPFVLGRKFTDYESRFFAFLIDLNLCLLPVYLWAVEFLLILTGVISPLYFDLLFYIMYGMLFITSCLILPVYTAAKKGQTYGDKICGIRVVADDGRYASPMKLVFYQLLGFGVPLMLFGYFFSVFGILFWWLINGLVVVVSPGQRSIFEWVFGLTNVNENAAFAAEQGEEEEELEEEEEEQEEPAPAPKPAPAAAPVQTQTQKAPVKIDLHLRSSYSDDGSYDVEQIFQQAKENEMEVISITDHNNARANAQAVRFAGMYGVDYIPGVEIDTQLYGERVRLLGYYIDWNDPVFDEIERASLKREKDVTLARIQAFEKAVGVRVDVDSLLSNSRFKILTPAALTDLVFNNKQARKLPAVANVLAVSVDEKSARERFMEEYFTNGGPCDIRAAYPDALKMISAIHAAGGLAVLSAWHARDLSIDVIESLLDAGLDGVEAFSPELDDAGTRYLVELAAGEKLFTTGGSDAHGEWRPERKMGHFDVPDKGYDSLRLITRASKK